MSRRPRGRGRKPQHNKNNNNPNRALDSNGPDVRVRGSAKTIYDKYMSLAHDASVSGRRVKAESYLQHAEHYLRIVQELAIVAAKKAEQHRLQTEQREAEQAARRAKHAEQAEKKPEKKPENNSDADGNKQDAKSDPSNGNGEEDNNPKRRVRSHLNRRKGQDKPEAAAKKDGDNAEVNKTNKPKNIEAEAPAAE